ncbi:MAG: hypothetical protein K2W96_05650, partial [Gemmataceae bacterium]|nr:hypothetical protein [Gemmataceae bacterium]
AVGVVLAARVPREEPAFAAGLLAGGGMAALLATVSLSPDWDSLGLLYGGLAVAGFVAATFAAVPSGWRRALGSGLIVFHFAAIFCAITVVPTASGPPPFLSSQAYVRLFHHYLIATNLNNGYHFYAPEPGPCALAWFRVQWDDGASAWVRIPDHAKVANHLERRRMGALATILTQSDPLGGPHAERLIQARIDAGLKHDPPIPVADLPMQAQYRAPGAVGRLLLASYVRHVARTAEHPHGKKDSVRVAGVKAYIVEYWNPPVEHFQAGQPPLDPTLYAAYYAGEYDEAGTLKKQPLDWVPETDKDGKPRKDKAGQPLLKQTEGDPFLYWRLPITRMEKLPLPPRPGEAPKIELPKGEPWKGEGRVINFVRIHAGDGDKEAVP